MTRSLSPHKHSWGRKKRKIMLENETEETITWAFERKVVLTSFVRKKCHIIVKK